LAVQLAESESSPNNNWNETQTINLSQTFEPTSDHLHNKNGSPKRLLGEEVDNSRKKRSKHNTGENEATELTAPSLHHKWSLTQPFLSSLVNTNSTITIGMFYSIDLDYIKKIILNIDKTKSIGILYIISR